MELNSDTTWVAINFTCPPCGGSGRVLLQPPGTMPTPSQCAACAGTGLRTVPLTLTLLKEFLLRAPDAAPETPAEEPPAAANATVVLPVVEAEAQPVVPTDSVAETEVNV